MTVAPHPDTVSRMVAQVFAELGVRLAGSSEVNENILIDNGRYVARSYRIQGWMAMWLIEMGIVQFYDRCGNMLRTVNLLEETLPNLAYRARSAA
jgi:hypothetical protein